MKVKIVVVPRGLESNLEAIKKAAKLPVDAVSLRIISLWNQPGVVAIHFTHETFDDKSDFDVLNHQTLGRETLKANHE